MLAAAVAGATLDPEGLLWQPGKRLISIPKPSLMTTGWVAALNLLPGDILTLPVSMRGQISEWVIVSVKGDDFEIKPRFPIPVLAVPRSTPAPLHSSPRYSPWS